VNQDITVTSQGIFDKVDDFFYVERNIVQEALLASRSVNWAGKARQKGNHVLQMSELT
jgi:hypothetical protein